MKARRLSPRTVAGFAMASLALSMSASAQEPQVLRRQDLLAKRMDGLSQDLTDAKADIGATAQRLQEVQMRIARLTQNLSAKISDASAQPQGQGAGFDWSRVTEDPEKVVQYEEQMGEMVTSLANSVNNPQVTKAMIESMGAQSRPLLEQFVETHPESRWADDIWLTLIFTVRDHDKDYNKALQMLDEAWAKRDQLKIEEEVKSSPLYALSNLAMNEDMVRTGQLKPEVNPMYLTIKQELWGTYKMLGNKRSAQQTLQEAYELAGKPETGDFMGWYDSAVSDTNAMK